MQTWTTLSDKVEVQGRGVVQWGRGRGGGRGRGWVGVGGLQAEEMERMGGQDFFKRVMVVCLLFPSHNVNTAFAPDVHFKVPPKHFPNLKTIFPDQVTTQLRPQFKRFYNTPVIRCGGGFK